MYPLDIGELSWNELKNRRLKRTRGVSFNELLDSNYLGIWNHPTRPPQQLMLFERKGYIWVVPCVREGDRLFLITLYASRKYTTRYKRGELP